MKLTKEQVNEIAENLDIGSRCFINGKLIIQETTNKSGLTLRITD